MAQIKATSGSQIPETSGGNMPSVNKGTKRKYYSVWATQVLTIEACHADPLGHCNWLSSRLANHDSTMSIEKAGKPKEP